MNRVRTKLRHPVDDILRARGSTQRWLAMKLRMDSTLLHHYLAGRRQAPPDLYQRIADVLQVPVSFIEPRDDVAGTTPLVA